MQEIYLDNAATTRALPDVCKAVQAALMESFGNPSSLHKAGLRAEEIVAASRRRLAVSLGVPERGIVFTSGGTEADNIAILGAARAYQRRGRHLITSAIEHKAVLESCQALKQEGWTVTEVDVDKSGIVPAEKVAEAVTSETVLVSIMAVNNEVGTIQPLKEIAQAVRSVKKDVLLHTDAVQALGKIPFHPGQWGMDLVTVSAHKMHGPKGCGALWVREGVRVSPITHGGGQEGGLRPGTENVPGIAGFGAALEEMEKHKEKTWRHLAAMQELLIIGVQKEIPGALVNGLPSAEIAPHICNLAFPGLRGEVLIHALAEKGVYVSAGSACSALKRNVTSHVLEAMGIPKRAAIGSLRFSLAGTNTEAEIEKAVQILKQVVEELGGVSQQ